MKSLTHIQRNIRITQLEHNDPRDTEMHNDIFTILEDLTEKLIEIEKQQAILVGILK